MGIKFNIFDVQRAYALFREEKYKEALKIYTEIYEYTKEDKINTSYIPFAIADCYYLMNDPLEAFIWVEIAVERDSLSIGINLLKYGIFGQIDNMLDDLVAKGEADTKVLPIYELMHEHGFVKSSTQFTMIKHYMNKGQFDQAKAFVENALERNPNDKDLLDLQLRILAKKESNDFKKAS